MLLLHDGQLQGTCHVRKQTCKHSVLVPAIAGPRNFVTCGLDHQLRALHEQGQLQGERCTWSKCPCTHASQDMSIVLLVWDCAVRYLLD